MDWESINRCVGRVKEGDTFNASWASALGGTSATALIGFVTVCLTNASGYALCFLGVLAVMSALAAFLVFKLEERSRKGRVSHLDALKEELRAIEKYMTSEKYMTTPGPPRGVSEVVAEALAASTREAQMGASPLPVPPLAC